MPKSRTRRGRRMQQPKSARATVQMVEICLDGCCPPRVVNLDRAARGQRGYAAVPAPRVAW